MSYDLSWIQEKQCLQWRPIQMRAFHSSESGYYLAPPFLCCPSFLVEGKWRAGSSHLNEKLWNHLKRSLQWDTGDTLRMITIFGPFLPFAHTKSCPQCQLKKPSELKECPEGTWSYFHFFALQANNFAHPTYKIVCSYLSDVKYRRDCLMSSIRWGVDPKSLGPCCLTSAWTGRGWGSGVPVRTCRWPWTWPCRSCLTASGRTSCRSRWRGLGWRWPGP